MIRRARPVGQSGVTLGGKERLTVFGLGQPGTGKTRLAQISATRDIGVGRGITYLDPHEDGYRLLTKWTAVEAEKDPELAEKVVLIDPMDTEWSPGINPLEFMKEGDTAKTAAFFTDLMIRVWNLDSSITVRMTWLLMHTSWALADLGLSLYEVPVFLRDHDWRKKVLERVESREVRQYFEGEYPTNDRLRTEWAQPVLNRVGKLVFDPDLACIFGQLKSTIPNFRKGMDQSMAYLVNLAKGRLGRENSAVLGSVIVGLEQQAFLSRADAADDSRPEHYMYLEEWQNFASSDLPEIVSESRKYGVRLVLLNQSLSQLSEEHRLAVLNLASSVICFRVGYHDAFQMAQQIWNPRLSRTRWRFSSLGRLPLVLPSWESVPVDYAWEACALELTKLRKREFWIRNRDQNTAFKQMTPDMPDPICSPQVLDALVARSGSRYARRKIEVMRELRVERPKLLAELARGHAPDVKHLSDGPWSHD